MRIKEASNFHHLLLLHRQLLMLLIICSYFQYYYCEGCHEEERKALLQIKDSINPINEDRLSNWVRKDCCKWDGIECDYSSSRVVRLDLHYVRNWTDELGSWYLNATLFNNFKMLKWLNLSHNQIDGIIGMDLPQSIGSLKMLRLLDLSYNKIGGIIGRDLLQSMSSLKKLRWLDLSHNYMDGNGKELVQAICQFNLIEHLDVSRNSLEGVVPPCLGNLTSLTFLDLNGNKFQGNISSLSRLNALETLDMSHNQFQGNILHLFEENHPISIRDASKFSNATISPPWKKLLWLDLSFNELTGDGWDAAQVVCQLSLLEFLWVNDNSLEGVLPPCFANLISLRVLSLGGNKFAGNIPAIDKMKAIEYVYLFDNGFEGDILNMFGQNHFVRDLSSPYGNMSSPLKKLQVLDLGYNALTGDGWDHFQAICQLKSLEEFSLDMNLLEGRLHPCLGMMHSISILSLSYNRFQGNVPPFLGGFNMNTSSLM